MLLTKVSHFSRLMAFRWLAIAIESLILLMAVLYLKIAVDIAPLAVIIGLHAILAVVGYGLLIQKKLPTDRSVFFFLLATP